MAANQSCNPVQFHARRAGCGRSFRHRFALQLCVAALALGPLGALGACSDADDPIEERRDSDVPDGRDGTADGSDGTDDGSPSGSPSGDDAGHDDDAGADDAPAAVGACAVRSQSHEKLAAPHLSLPLSPDDYNSRPPSSGPHCSSWGQYAVYGSDSPLPACNFVHNLEHGAIALLYNCPDGCDELVQALQAVMNEPPRDPDCAPVRLLLTPYAEMPARVAAVAWGYTWTADCLDDEAQASLLEFIAAHWGRNGEAPEPRVCSGGSVGP